MREKREFCIDTPLGKLKVYAKHSEDKPNEFPGVFVDFVGKDEDICLACVEYDSVAKGIYAHLYGDIYSDCPTDSTRYEGLEDVQ